MTLQSWNVIFKIIKEESRPTKHSGLQKSYVELESFHWSETVLYGARLFCMDFGAALENGVTPDYKCAVSELDQVEPRELWGSSPYEVGFLWT